MEEKLLTVQQAAEALGCGLTQTYKFLNAGTLRAVKIGKLTRIPQSAINEFIGSLQPFKAEGGVL